VYSRNIKERELTFGVSGLLYKSNVLLYDHQTESLWSQIKGKAVTGRMTGTPLEVLPSTFTTWKKWKKRFPETEVLSTDTGYDRDYSKDPYESYYKRKKGLFSFFTPGPGEEEKQLVAGVRIDSTVKAYPLDVLRKKKKIADRLGDREITLTFDPETDVLTIQDTHGKDIPYMIVYWFVWKSIHSDSDLFRLKK
jgi:hypothetical protein